MRAVYDSRRRTTVPTISPGQSPVTVTKSLASICAGQSKKLIKDLLSGAGSNCRPSAFRLADAHLGPAIAYSAPTTLGA